LDCIGGLLFRTPVPKNPCFLYFPYGVDRDDYGYGGFSPSVSRAGFMVLMLYGGKLVNAQADSLNSLGLSVLILSVLNPFAPGHIGLQLSFFATLGIVLSANSLTEIAERLRLFSERKHSGEP
jgi:predicted membrane metal-binding protein